MMSGWIMGFLLIAAVGASAQTRGRRSSQKGQFFTLGAKVETSRSLTEITDTSIPLADTGVDLYAQKSSGLVTGTFTFGLGRGGEVGGHVGFGRESITTTIDVDASGGGPSINDTRYEDDLVLELGGFYKHDLGQSDIVGSLLFRSGEAEADRPGTEEITYTYTLIRLAGEVGFKPAPGVRPFLQLRYTMYDGEWDYENGGFMLTYDLELDSPFGVGVGVDLGTDRFSSRLQFNFVDVEEIGFLASLGIDF